MLQYIKSLFAWRVVRETPVWIYMENTVTGRRKAIEIAGAGWQPVAVTWLQDRDGWAIDRHGRKTVYEKVNCYPAQTWGDVP